MTTTVDGGPAFPCDMFDPDVSGPDQHEGMSLRDYFASRASEFDVRCALEDLGRSGGLTHCGTSMARNAVARYACADAMLRARLSAPIELPKGDA